MVMAMTVMMVLACQKLVNDKSHDIQKTGNHVNLKKCSNGKQQRIENDNGNNKKTFKFKNEKIFEHTYI